MTSYFYVRWKKEASKDSIFTFAVVIWDFHFLLYLFFFSFSDPFVYINTILARKIVHV